MSLKYINTSTQLQAPIHTKGQPLDGSDIVETASDLSTLISQGYAYKGKKVYVESEDKTYRYNGTSFVPDAGTTTVLSPYQEWLTLEGNSGKTLAQYYEFLQEPAKTAADALPDTLTQMEASLKSYVDEELAGASISGIVNTVETGFYVTDQNGNIGLGFDANGLEVTKFGDSAKSAIVEAAGSNVADIPPTSIVISGDQFIQLSSTPVTFTCLVLPLDCTDKRVMWKCNNGIIYGQDDKTCKILFTAIGYSLITCYSIADPSISTTFQVSVLNSLSDPSVILNYKFTNIEPSSAIGTVELASTSADTFTVYWGDDSGILPDMSEIFSATITSGLLKASFKLAKGWMIPQPATKVYVKRSSGELYIFDLPFYKLFNTAVLGAKLYSFGIVSDVHCGTVSDNTGYSLTKDIPAAWDYFNAQGVNFITGVGDMTNAGTVDQLASFKGCIESHNPNSVPTYCCFGNHDRSTSDYQAWFNTFGVPADFTLQKGNPANNTTSSDFLLGERYREDIPETDLFIFVTCNASPGIDQIKSERRTWVENIVMSNQGKRIFLYEHIPLEGTCGDINDSYTGSIPPVTSASHIWFMNLLKTYKNVIFFSGHTHFPWENVVYYDSLNVYDGDATNKYGYMIHIPSLGLPRVYREGSSPSIEHKRSQGGIIDVYKDYIVIRGRDFGTLNDDLVTYAVAAHDVPAGQIILKTKQQ